MKRLFLLITLLVARSLGAMELNKPQEWDDFVTNISGVAEDMNVLTKNVRDGDGTVGKLISTDDLYLRLTSVLNKGETVMDDINHYGLLFHNSKAWQRLRARRMNLLEKLSTPQEFQNYFNDEVDQITTSLSRVSIILQETDECNTPVVCSPEFVKVFANLLRRVEGLENDIKLYNQQIVEKREKECCLSPCPGQ